MAINKILFDTANDVTDIFYEASTPPSTHPDDVYNSNPFAKCDLCVFNTNDVGPQDEIAYEMIRHFKEMHKTSVINYHHVHSLDSVQITKKIQILLHCNVCNERLDTLAKLKQHFTIQHVNTICTATILEKSSQVDIVEIGIAIGCFHCDNCKKYLISKKQLFVHSAYCSNTNANNVKMWYEIDNHLALKNQINTDNSEGMLDFQPENNFEQIMSQIIDNYS